MPKIEGRQDTCQRSLHVAFSALQGSPCWGMPFYMPMRCCFCNSTKRDDDTRHQNYIGADNNGTVFIRRGRLMVMQPRLGHNGLNGSRFWKCGRGGGGRRSSCAQQ